MFFRSTGILTHYAEKGERYEFKSSQVKSSQVKSKISLAAIALAAFLYSLAPAHAVAANNSFTNVNMMTFYSTSARITKVAEDHATDTFIMTMAVPAYLSGGSLNVTLNAGGGYTSLAFPRSKLTPVCLAVISEAQNAAITIKALLTNPPTTVYPRLDIHFFNASGYTNGYDYVSVSTASGVECSLIKY